MRELPDGLRVVCSLVVAALLFGLAYRQFTNAQGVIERAERRGIARENVPPTMIGQYGGLGVALVALGLICVVLALRKEDVAGEHKPNCQKKHEKARRKRTELR